MNITGGRYHHQYINANEDPSLTGFNLTSYKVAPYLKQMAQISNRYKLEWDYENNAHSYSAATIAKIVSFFGS
jgi:hypothetical protein